MCTPDCLRLCFLIVLILFVWIKVANYSWTILQFLILIVSNEVILNVLFPGPAPGPAGIRRRDPVTSHSWFWILLAMSLDGSALWWQVVSLTLCLSLPRPWLSCCHWWYPHNVRTQADVPWPAARLPTAACLWPQSSVGFWSPRSQDVSHAALNKQTLKCFPDGQIFELLFG